MVVVEEVQEVVVGGRNQGDEKVVLFFHLWMVEESGNRWE